MATVAARIHTYLKGLEVSGLLYCRSDLAGTWGVAFPPFESCAMFHLVTEGKMWLEDRWMEAGDFVLMPRGQGHAIRSQPGAPARSIFEHDRLILNPRCEVLRTPGEGPETKLMCGVVRLDHPGARHLLEALPAVIHLRAAEAPALSRLMELIAEEARFEGSGSFSVLTKLADVLIVQSIRYWLETATCEDLQGRLGALSDDRICQALDLMHQAPGRPWTLSSLASEVAMSRASFAQRFTELVGEPAMTYLTHWRMDLAAKRLTTDPTPIASLAFDLGYESETSFSQAFKRIKGLSPGAYRKQAKSGGDSLATTRESAS